MPKDARHDVAVAPRVGRCHRANAITVVVCDETVVNVVCRKYVTI